MWACPNKAMNKVIVQCAICGDYSHPTSDCPDRKSFLATNTPISIEAQYKKLLNDIDGKKMAIEDEYTSKGGMSFITEENNLVKMITNQPNWSQGDNLEGLANQMGLPLEAIAGLRDGSINPETFVK